MDLSVPNDIRRTIRDVRPRLIVNAAAYAAVDQAERDETKARIINAEAPALIAEEAKAIGAAMVHYSTDYIFDESHCSDQHKGIRYSSVQTCVFMAFQLAPHKNVWYQIARLARATVSELHNRA
jgi:hypothetical protein